MYICTYVCMTSVRGETITKHLLMSKSLVQITNNAAVSRLNRAWNIFAIRYRGPPTQAWYMHTLACRRLKRRSVVGMSVCLPSSTCVANCPAGRLVSPLFGTKRTRRGRSYTCEYTTQEQRFASISADSRQLFLTIMTDDRHDCHRAIRIMRMFLRNY